MSAHSIEVDTANFQQVVIEGSKQAPVIVDFWAPWCAPCRALTPVLDKLAGEYQGKFTLAKINSDENQELAAKFGVRGIPSVKAIVNGQLVDEFSGALPEAGVREFLDRVIPSPAEELRLQAMQVYGNIGDAKQALELLAQASESDPVNEAVNIDRAAIMIDLGNFESAGRLLDALSPLTQMDDRVVSLKARVGFAASIADAPDAESLRLRIAHDTNDLEARLQLANWHVGRQDYAAALEELLDIVHRDRAFRDDIARKTMLQVFSLLGNQGELVSAYRKRLASAMY
jgi:putative thioredoxin